MKIKLVAFDWNGTILDDLEGMVRANNAVFRHFNLEPISVEKYRDTFQVPIKSYWVALGYDPNIFDQIAEEQEKTFQINYEPEERKALTREGAAALLSFLKSKQINSVIFSNHVAPHIETKLRQLNLETNFDAILARPLNGRGHQHKRFKDQILQEYVESRNLLPYEVAVVGDTDEEIEIGHKFGYTTIALSGGHQSIERLQKHKPHYLVNNLTDIIDILNNHE